MTTSYNLLHEKWIGCKTTEGTMTQASLSEVLIKAHEIKSLSVQFATHKVALFRFLLAILHRNFGPATKLVWQTIWDEGRFDEKLLAAYFARWEKRFDLFDADHPFYQTKKIDTEVRPINGYSFHLGIYHIASGNNATLFDHHLEEEAIVLSPAEAIYMILNAQSFAFGFRSFKDGPSARGVNFILEGESLFESLMMNMVIYHKEKPYPVIHDDLPAWEREDALTPDRTKPDGYLDYLTWQTRKILLHRNDSHGNVDLVQVDNGLRLDIHSEPYFQNPMMYYSLVENPNAGAPPFRPLKLVEGRSLWRDSTSLLEIRSDQAEPPQALQQINNRSIDRNQYRLSSIGISSDQGKVNFYRDELFVFPKDYLGNDTLISYLKTSLAQAEAVRKKLWGAINSLVEMVISPEADLEGGRPADKQDKQQLMEHIFAESLFWASLERHYYTLVNDLVAKGEDAMDTWQQELRKSAWQAFGYARDFVGNSSNALKAGAVGGRILGAGLKAIFAE